MNDSETDSETQSIAAEMNQMLRWNAQLPAGRTVSGHVFGSQGFRGQDARRVKTQLVDEYNMVLTCCSTVFGLSSCVESLHRLVQELKSSSSQGSRACLSAFMQWTQRKGCCSGPGFRPVALHIASRCLIEVDSPETHFPVMSVSMRQAARRLALSCARVRMAHGGREARQGT